MLLNTYSLLITRSSMISCEGGKVLSLLIKKPLMSFFVKKVLNGVGWKACTASEIIESCLRNT